MAQPQRPTAGYGSFTFSNGDKYTGEWANSEPHGRGKMEFTNGNVYEGNFINGKKEGTGFFRWANGATYIGSFKNGLKDGKGVYTNANGDSYEGELKYDQPEGKGVHTYADGRIYIGEWKNNKREGEFTYIPPRGEERSKVFFRNGVEYIPTAANTTLAQPQRPTAGYGSFTFSNGDKYTGEWANSLPYGWGKAEFTDGNVYEGNFRNGLKEGTGVERWEDGNSYNGEWKNNLMDGRGVFKFEDGRKYVGEWKKGNKEGKFTYTTIEREESEVFFVNNRIYTPPSFGAIAQKVFFVKTLFGKTITLEVEPKETIFQIKTKIYEQEGIPIEEQHLIYDGIQLEDHHTLAYYRINARTVFYLDQSGINRGIICPLSNRIMTDPVIAADGYTYERSAIQERFDNGNYTSPITHDPLPNNNLIPNLALRQIKEHLCEQNPHLCR